MMNALIRLAAMACTLCTIAQFTAADVLMRVPVGDASEKQVELEASRTTTTHLLPPTGHIGYVEKRLVDTVEVAVSGPGDEKTRIWLKTHEALGEAYSRCVRLALYDVRHDSSGAWVLYSVECAAYIDRVVRGDDNQYRVVDTIPVVELSDSGIDPYLLSTGAVVADGETIHVSFKLFGSSHAVHDLEHPYVFWTIREGKAIAIEDADRRDALKEQHAGLLEKPNRPRFIEQVLARPDDEK